MFSRTLGTALGDWVADAKAGLALSRYWASAALAIFIVVCIALLPKRAERRLFLPRA